MRQLGISFIEVSKPFDVKGPLYFIDQHCIQVEERFYDDIVNEVEDHPNKSHFRIKAQAGDHKSDMTNDKVAKYFPQVVLCNRSQSTGNNGENSHPRDQFPHKIIRNEDEGKYPKD